MSRLAKKPIDLPKGVEIKLHEGVLTVKGPKGSFSQQIPSDIHVKVEGNEVHVLINEKTSLPYSFHGLYRSLVMNAIVGVSSGYEKKLTLIGVGYRATVKGDFLDLQLGFSHPCQIKIPQDLKVTVEKSTAITIVGVDKKLVGQFAANVRIVKKPEPYKGKGVRYDNEVVRKKAGKTAKGK